jgi:4-amino-4-deoxy-L-arabinose transferase-like glycosyltransferase
LNTSQATRPEAQRSTPENSLAWPGMLYGLIALLGCVFAFVGLSHNSFWADELYTIQIVNHHGGVAEMFRRVLADVHPPLYNFVLYGWTQRVGISDAAARLPSAVCAVTAIALFAFGVRKRVSPTAAAFACAVATTSMFWFVQSQNVRDYPLAMLLSSALLATAIQLDQRTRTDSRFPLGIWLGLTLLGIAGSQTHPYMLLTVGVLLLFLLITARTWPLRFAMAGTGLLILALYAGLLWLMAHKTGRQDFHGTWFSNKPKFLFSQLRRTLLNFMNRQSLAVVVAMLLVVWSRFSRGPTRFTPKRGDDSEARRTTRLCWFVFLGVIVSGIAVSILVAPSFSYRNVLVCAPFGWFLVARLYDVAGPRIHTRIGQAFAALAILLVGSQLVVLIRGRLLPTNEPWRATAAYVQSLPGCGDATLPVIALPNTYGAASLTPGVRDMVERDYYGYYLPATSRLHAYSPDQLLQQLAHSTQSGAQAANACPMIGWAMHGIDDESVALALGEQIASSAGIPDHRIVMQELVAYQLHWLSWKPEPNAFVYLYATSDTVHSPVTLASGTDMDRKHSLGDRLVITDVTSAANTGTATRTYAIQRWRDRNIIGETTVSASASRQLQADDAEQN